MTGLALVANISSVIGLLLSFIILIQLYLMKKAFNKKLTFPPLATQIYDDTSKFYDLLYSKGFQDKDGVRALASIDGKLIEIERFMKWRHRKAYKTLRNELSTTIAAPTQPGFDKCFISLEVFRASMIQYALAVKVEA